MGRFATTSRVYYDDNGDVLALGKVYFYEPGTNTLLTTYQEVGESTANANPVILSAAGLQPDVFFTGRARIVITDADDVQVEIRDPIVVA